MMNRGVMELTGKATTADAWDSLVPYKSGEVVLIKFNFNNSDAESLNNRINPLPETANAIIAGLTLIGIPGNRIWIADPSRVISARFRNGILNPDIQFYGQPAWDGDPNYHPTDYVRPNSPAASIATCPAGEKILPAQVFVDAHHLINVPMFKGSIDTVTLALKNHYGSVLFENYDRWGMHDYFFPDVNISGSNLEVTNILADINNNPHIKDKTRLVIGEGFFGNAYIHWQETKTWSIFNNGDPNMLFLSVNPVAISSVMADYIHAERGQLGHHEQLHAAAHLGLGVHEHWDSFNTKRYPTIQYIQIG